MTEKSAQDSSEPTQLAFDWPELGADPGSHAAVVNESTGKLRIEKQQEGSLAASKRFHQFANLFPMLADDSLQQLAEDIKDRGLLDPIMLLEGQILDGRCRYAACEIAGVEPKFEQYGGDDPLGYVLSRNLHRRHLTESQRAMVAAKAADLKPGANQHSEGLPIGRAAHLLSVGQRSVARAREVLRRGVPELAKAVEVGELPVSSAAKISRMTMPEQRERVASALDRAKADGRGRINRSRKSATGKTDKSKTQHSAMAAGEASTSEIERRVAKLVARGLKPRDELEHIVAKLMTERIVAQLEAEHYKAQLAKVPERLRQIGQSLEDARAMLRTR
jgi:ParB-like nuclease domain